MYKTLTAFLDLLINQILLINFFLYIKMPEDSSAKYYQDNKERLTKNLFR